MPDARLKINRKLSSLLLLVFAVFWLATAQAAPNHWHSSEPHQQEECIEQVKMQGSEPEGHQHHQSLQECSESGCLQCSYCSTLLTSLPGSFSAAFVAVALYNSLDTHQRSSRIERPPKHLFEA